MTWTGLTLGSPALPQHCEPANDFLLRFSSTFHVCVPRNLAFISSTLGILSIAAWLSAQLPQIWKNYNLKSTSGLSIYFLIEWCLGDLGNLLGAVFTHQQPWQIAIGAYYVFVDCCLVLQWFWYERLKHGRPIFRIRAPSDDRPPPAQSAMHEVIVEGVQPLPYTDQSPNDRKTTRAKPIFRTPTFDRPRSTEHEKASPSTPGGTKVYRFGPSTSFAAASPKTIIMIACLVAVARGSPVTTSLVTSMQTEKSATTHGSSLEFAGTILSWMSTVLYIGSRFPQIFKNWSRKSTSGLSAHLFAAAFCGNLFYSAALATNPCAWSDLGPHGGGGWVGADGSRREEWILNALPFFLGAAGVLALDATVGMQFVLYGEDSSKVIVVERGEGQRWKWRRVSGWMRGWIPSVRDEAQSNEGRRLLDHRSAAQGEGYGAL